MKLNYIEICGFRSYGPQPQRIELTAPITVIHADNSQGKTSLAEAFEFLYTGGTSRRQLGGGSPGEFEGALRNAHLSESAQVYVEAEICLPDGTCKVLRRELVNDYQGAADCVSILALDGAVIESAADAGFQLSDPPLSAPVLLEHALRYAVSAKPGERSDYFKAVLEVTDLDLLRAEVSSAISERESQPREPLVLKFESLRSHPQVGALVTSTSAWTETQLSAALLSALNALVPPTDGEFAAVDALSAAVERVEGELAARQKTLVPIKQLRPSDVEVPIRRARFASDPSATPEESLSTPTPEPTFVDQLDSYNTAVDRIDASVAKLLPLFHAVLSIDGIPHQPDDRAVDCPVCETPGALSVARIDALREQVADQEGLTIASENIRTAISDLSSDLTAIGRWASAVVPDAAEWADKDRGHYESSVAELEVETSSFADLLQLAVSLKSSAKSVQVQIDASVVALANISEQIKRSAGTAKGDLAALTKSEEGLRQAIAAHKDLASRARRDADPVISVVEPVLAARSNTSGWAELLELARDPRTLLEALESQDRRNKSTVRLKAAERKITKAIKEVVDQKLELMATEIRKWWSLMRPDELTTFDRLARRGAGNRYLDLTASLVPEVDASGVVRNALAVLSNSQLNALGLSTFLARCRLLGNEVIFLDDPVPGSDREHRYTFAGSVTSELLTSGSQLVVTTHDAELARTLQSLHQHSGTGEYSIALVDARQGSSVLRTGDDFERLMLTAQGQMSSPLHENRRAAGNSLRVAAERLTKHILVAARQANGEVQAVLADYDGKNLSELRPLVVAHSKAANEPGQWQTLARILNDADHDTDPPQPADLKTCYSMLREIKKRHGVRTASSATT